MSLCVLISKVVETFVFLQQFLEKAFED